MGLILDNALGWAQFKLRGGWKGIGTYSGIYVAAILGLVFFTAQMNPGRRDSVYEGWMNALLFIQSGVLILFGANRITNAIRNDVTQKVIESHRLMPVPPTHAMLGYIAGSTVQAIAIFTLNIVVGLALALAVQADVMRWMVQNFMLLSAAICLWTVAALMAFFIRGAMGGILMLISIGTLGQQGLTVVLPGVTVLGGPLLMRFIQTGFHSEDITMLHIASSVAQMMLASVFFVGATRKYRDTDAQAFSPPLALGLLVIWSAASVMGLNFWPGDNRVFDEGSQGPIIASLIAGMLVAIIPVCSSALATMRWQRQRRLDPDSPGVRPLPPLICIIVAAALVVAVPFLCVESTPAHRALADKVSLTIIFAHLVTTYAVAQILYRMTENAGRFLILWVAVFWLLPLLALTMSDGFVGESEAPLFISISPIGALVHLYSYGLVPIVGIAVQATVAVAALAAMIATAKPREAALTPA